MSPVRRTLWTLLPLVLLVAVWLWLRVGADSGPAHDPDGGSQPTGPEEPAPPSRSGVGLDAAMAGDADRAPVAEAPGDDAAAEGFVVRGRCFDPAGRGLADVRVLVNNGGTPVEGFSGADGRFDLGPVARPGEVSAELADHELVHRHVPRPVDGVLEATLVLAPTTDLEVRALDVVGRPVEGLAVRATPSTVEPYGRQDAGYREFQPPSARGETDAEGVARVAGAAADMRLRVRVGDLECEWVDPGTGELREERAGAVPIVLRPGAPRTLVARLGPVVRLHGRVLEEDGSPAAGAEVNAFTLDLERDGRPVHLGHAAADEDGRFALRGVAPGPTREVQVTALSVRGASAGGGMFSGRRYADPRCEASETVALDPEGRAGRELVLRVAPRPKLEGRVVDPDGRGLRAHVTLVPVDAGPESALSGRTGRLTRRCGSDGDFRFPSLPPGTYDVLAHDGEGAHAALRAIEAGRTDLELTLEPGPRARVHVEVRSREARDQTILLVTRLEPAPGVGENAPELAEDQDLRAPRGWPEPALGLWYGAQSYHGALGEAMFASGPMASDARTLELVPGLYWIGAKARLAGGGFTFPMGTGLVRVRPGEHHLRLHVEPQARLEGRVLGATPEQALCVAVATPDGRLVPLNVRAEAMREVCDLSAAGTFVLPAVPSGTLELRVGTYEQLRAGGATLRRTVEVPPGETLRVELGG